MNKKVNEKTSSVSNKVRLDKWLWAARFFKTRNIAKQAIESGKVHVNGQRTKPSKELEVGAELTIRNSWTERTIVVTALSEQRKGAPQAVLLYSETEQSLIKRTKLEQQRKAIGENYTHPVSKPTTKERRLIHRFKRENNI